MQFHTEDSKSPSRVQNVAFTLLYRLRFTFYFYHGLLSIGNDSVIQLFLPEMQSGFTHENSFTFACFHSGFFGPGVNAILVSQGNPQNECSDERG